MDKSVNKMFEKTIHVLQDQKEYLAYIRAEQADLDYKAQIKYATEIGAEKGEKKGIKKGIEKGIKKGVAIGAEKKEIEIAKNLKNKGFPLEIIAETTGLTLEKIKKL